MHVVIDRTALLGALERVKGALGGSTIPIQSHFLLQAEDAEQLRVTACDGDKSITATVPARVERLGALAVCGRLHDVVRRSADGCQIELRAGEVRIKVHAGRAKFELVTLPAADFPAMVIKGGRRFAMPADHLRSIFASVAYAQATDDTRYYLNGVYLHSWEDSRDGLRRLRGVATDAHRLARVEVPCPENAEAMPGIIVARNTVGDMARLLEALTGAVTVTVTDTLLGLAGDGVEMVSRLVEGTYPDYERVIPSGNDKVCEVDAALLAAAVERVTTIGESKTRLLRITFAQAGLTLACSSPDLGSAVEEVEGDYSGSPIDIGFNGKYLTETLKRITGEGVRLEIGDPAGPVILRDLGAPEALYVVMPARV
ncbi:DNA polymerase III subunit beta [Azospirillum argentinense]|uniref:DNA polymerase III subunit beta n=1 Tax=Azospirillum argentinense TaxID=2970906 RepID=UPI00190DFF88|nr:DNA polymerase III subunit beta [Azospirillum argentinense]